MFWREYLVAVSRGAGVGNRGNVGLSLGRGLVFRMAGVGGRGVCGGEHSGCALRVAGVGLRMHVGAWEGAGRRIRVAVVGNCALGRRAACVSRGRCGEW